MSDEQNSKSPDVKKLLAQVDAAVQEKKAAGLYDPAEVRKVEQAVASFQQSAEAGSAAELNLWQKTLIELVNPTDWGVETHRGGPAGKAIVALKKLIYKASKFFLNVWLATQVKYNAALIRLTGVIIPQHIDMRMRLPQAEQRIELLEDLCRDLTAGLRNVREAEARLGALERQAFSGREQIEPLLAQLERMAVDLAAKGQLSPDAAGQLRTVREAARDQAYLDFEDIHRGSPEEIKARQKVYLPFFKQSVTAGKPLLDIGCGRGEFLAAAKEAGLAAKGVDLNAQSVAQAKEQGLDADANDAIAYLRSVADGSLGGILMAQVIEHLSLDQLMELLGLCAAKLAQGGWLIAETVNPQCLSTFSSAFYLDLTHNKPIHPEAARFLWRRLGLDEVEVLHLSDMPPDHKLELVDDHADGASLEASFNRNMQRLNQLLYSYQDYAVVGRK